MERQPAVDTWAWLRRVLPAWLLWPLYAVPLAWLGQLYLASRDRLDFDPPEGQSIALPDGSSVTVPPVPGGPLMRIGVHLIGYSSFGAGDVLVCLLALVGMLVVVLVARTSPESASVRWPVAPLVGAAWATLVCLGALLAPVARFVASDYLAASLVFEPIAQGGMTMSAVVWSVDALVAGLIAVAFVQLARHPAPVTAVVPMIEETAAPAEADPGAASAQVRPDPDSEHPTGADDPPDPPTPAWKQPARPFGSGLPTPQPVAMSLVTQSPFKGSPVDPSPFDRSPFERPTSPSGSGAAGTSPGSSGEGGTPGGPSSAYRRPEAPR
jgi:hypothetical protein